MIQLKSELSIQMSGHQSYPGFTDDGERLYFTARDRHISVVDELGVFERNIYTRRVYSALCHDAGRGCFWAVSPNNYGTIFQLSQDFQERNYMRFRIRNARLGPIQSICYDASSNQFVLVIASTIYMANFDGVCQPMNVEKQLQDTCIACACGGRYLFCMVQQNDTYRMMVVSKESGKVMEEVDIPEGNHPVSLVARVEAETGMFGIKVYGSSSGGNESVIEYKYSAIKEEHGEEHHHIEESTQIVEEHQEQQSWDLEKVYADILSGLLESQSSGNNCEHCTPQCKPKCPPPCPPACPPPCPPACCHDNCHAKGCEYICLEILESIACVETSIACILNSEGEKLQKAIKCSCNVKDLLKINESIQKTIIHSVHLEQLLYSKMEMVFEKCLNK